ncbi:MAG TPA: pitrilysin family protein [Candidatus Angelobacter sp.]|nr:pitrilysin family protein [Candidatus Angelobacter sp.]
MPDVPIERHRLDNGLRIVLSPDRRAPLVAVNLWYDVGSKHEKPGKTGFAHLFEHMMFQGSANVERGQHFALINAAGGTLNATTWLDRTNYFETLPGHELELALWLEADRLGGLLPAMTQEKLDTERDVVKNERRLRIDNQPYGTWDEKLFELLYPESHPYHHPTIGSMEDLSNASLDDISEFFATYYVPNNAVLTVAGDFESDAALEMIRRHFGPLAPNEDLPAPPDMTVDPTIGEERRLVVPDRVPLPRIYLAYRTPVFGTDAFDALDVAADTLANGRASRLYRRLVREERLAQDVTAFVLPIVGGAATAILVATARPGVEAERLEAAVLAEVDRLAAEGPSQAELDRVGNLYAARVASALERISERADQIGMYTCLFDDPERVNRQVERYRRVDAGGVSDAMRASFRPDNRVVVTYVPAEAAA